MQLSLARRAQWFAIISIIFACIVQANFGAHTLLSTPTLFFEGEPITLREGIDIVKMDELALGHTDLTQLPAFTNTEDEHRWWNQQREIYRLISSQDQISIAFIDKTENAWEIIADKGYLKPGDMMMKIGLIFFVSFIYLVVAVTVMRRHDNLAGFVCAFFLASTALYFVSVAPVVHRPILMDPEKLRWLIDVFFVASTGQISIVHFSLLFPEKKAMLQRYPLLVWVLYGYSAALSILYLTGKIALATSVPVLFFWILFMLSAFGHSMWRGTDEFMRKQIITSFMAPLLVSLFFVVSVFLPWSSEGAMMNNFSLFSLMLPFALILSLDNLALYKQRIASERNLRLEKERIHRELHDTVLNDLASISIVAEGAQRCAEVAPDKVPAKLTRIKEYTTESSRKLRNFLWVIDDRHNDWSDIIDSMRKLGYDLLSNSNIGFELVSHRAGREVPRPSPGIKHTIYQVLREALINVTKHSEANHVTVTIRLKSDLLELQVADDGRGMENEEIGSPSGHGLKNIATRLKEMHGDFEIVSAPGKETSLICRIPLQ